MKTTTTMILSLPLAAALLAGCANRHGYVNPVSVHFDKPENATLYDMNTGVADLVAKLQNDDGFLENYELKASKKPNGDLPVLQIGNIDSEAQPGERVTQKVESARRRIEIALRKTRLFEIKDDAAAAESNSENLAASIVKNAETGLEGDGNVQHFGEHVSADYQMYGRFRTIRDGDRYTHELSLELFDIATGRKIWNDLLEIAKE